MRHVRFAIVLFVGLSTGVTGCKGCRRESAASRVMADTGAADAGPVATVADAGRRPRKRLPPPLRPPDPSMARKVSRDSPCALLVSRACALVTEGSEECAEARIDLAEHGDAGREERCATTMEWFRGRIEESKKVKPCVLLADVVCATSGPDSEDCRVTREDSAKLKDDLHRQACLAALLLFKSGFQRPTLEH